MIIQVGSVWSWGKKEREDIRIMQCENLIHLCKSFKRERGAENECRWPLKTGKGQEMDPVATWRREQHRANTLTMAPSQDFWSQKLQNICCLNLSVGGNLLERHQKTKRWDIKHKTMDNVLQISHFFFVECFYRCKWKATLKQPSELFLVVI